MFEVRALVRMATNRVALATFLTIIIYYFGALEADVAVYTAITRAAPATLIAVFVALTCLIAVVIVVHLGKRIF